VATACAVPSRVGVRTRNPGSCTEAGPEDAEGRLPSGSRPHGIRGGSGLGGSLVLRGRVAIGDGPIGVSDVLGDIGNVLTGVGGVGGVVVTLRARHGLVEVDHVAGGVLDGNLLEDRRERLAAGDLGDHGGDLTLLVERLRELVGVHAVLL
jgi:hypothetical protein